jgi:glucosamine kinase
MILVADSGSTKCDWIYIGGGSTTQRLESPGLNPTFLSSNSITAKVAKTFKNIDTNRFTQIFFYGAGCSSDHNNEIVAEGLRKVFAKAEVHVSHDIEGSAIATCANKEGIACILGTGSNACFWSGKKINPQIPVFGMSYILGDEGSGAYLGKMLLKAFFYNQMPINLSMLLKGEGINKSVVEENVYNKPGANVYLASFTRFIYEHRTDKFMHELIKKAFRDFFDTHIVHYKKHKTVPVNFVGSVAFLFQDELKQVAKEYKVRIDTIIKQPIDNLLQHHLKPVKNQPMRQAR